MAYKIHQLPTTPRRRVPKRRWLIVGLVLLVGIYGIARFLDSPAQGHQEPVDQKLVPAKAATAPVTPASTATNHYFSLQLPAGYTSQAVSTSTPGMLLSQTILKASDEGSLIINIGVTAADGGLANNSSYRLRQQNPQTYRLSSQTINGSTVTIATRIDGSGGEVVAFWPHGSYLATASVNDGIGGTSSGDTAGDQAVLTTLLKAWQWQ